MIDVLSTLVQYMLLVESFTSLATPVVVSLRELVGYLTVVHEAGYSRRSRKGRPRIDVEEEQLVFLIDANFRLADIASMFGCSRRTIERRLREFGITSHEFTSISDHELDQAISDIVSVHPQSGEKTILGNLRSQSIKIQRERVRQSLRRVDPLGIESRARRVLRRRVYQVPSPNSLWHCDGYHKLIRWKIVIHGAIDGYSRLIMYLKAACNNRATTVLSAFNSAVEEYGLPSRIRMDRGGENILIGQLMLSHPERGIGRKSVLVGKSVHNQRIERLWRDVYAGCVCFFYNFFYFLEDINVLDISNEVDLCALHFVFLPIIQTQLNIFRDGWANHSLRTAGNSSPLQLWILGLHFMNNTDNQNSVEIAGLNDVSMHVVQLQ